MVATQLTWDFSRRGDQLRVLERMQFDRSYKHGSRAVSGSACKTVLRAIDDCIGSEPVWDISIGRLCSQSGLSRGTVSAAIAMLERLLLIAVTVRHAPKDGTFVELPHRFQILWTMLPEFVPTESPVREVRRQVLVEREMGSLTVRRPPSHGEMTPISQRDDPHLTVRRPPSHGEMVPAPIPSNPVQSTLPPAATKGRRWRWLDKKIMQNAVARGDSEPVKRAYTEAIESGDLIGDACTLRAFAATFYDVAKCESPVGVLAYRWNSGEITEVSVPAAALQWADRVLGRAATRKPAAECWLCKTRGEKSPTCDVCGTKPYGQPRRGTTKEDLVHA